MTVARGDYVSVRKLRCDGPGRLRGTVDDILGGMVLLAIGDEYLVWCALRGARKLSGRVKLPPVRSLPTWFFDIKKSGTPRTK